MNDIIHQGQRTWNITEQTLYLLQVLLLFYCFPLEKCMPDDDDDDDDDDAF